MKRVSISEIVEKPVSGEWGNEAENSSDGIPVIRNTNFSDDGRIDLQDVAYRKISERKITKKKLKPGDIIIEKSGGSENQPVGRVVYFDIDDGKNYLFSNFTSALRPKDEVEPKYVHFALLHSYQRGGSELFQNKTTGIRNLQLDRYLDKIDIPLPSLCEQKKIVAKLDRAQRLIDIDREMLAKYDELIQSVFLEMFGDPVRNAKGWERKVFSKVFDITTGKLNANAAVEDGKYPFFTCSREISWIDNYAFDTEALLLAGNNASGDFNIKYYNGKFNAYQRTYVLTSEENYGFLKIALDYFLNQMKSDSIGTNTKYLTLTLLDRMKIPIPPIDLQNKFNDIITKIDEEKRIVNQQQIKKSEELFSSLVQGVFG